MVVRLIATDLDGTLVRSDGSISLRTRSALQAAERAGIAVAILTGRPVRWMGQILAETAHRGIAACIDGAVLYDLKDQRVVHAHAFPGDQVIELLQLMNSLLPGVAVACEWADECARTLHYMPAGEIAADTQCVGLPELTAVPIVKIFARHAALRQSAVATGVLEKLRRLAYTAIVPCPGKEFPYLAMSPVGVTKRSALERLAGEHHFVKSSEIVAFGDMINDLPMLDWAGTGVAMANAHPEVISVADAVTSSNDDDGVAVWIERMLGSELGCSEPRHNINPEVAPAPGTPE